MLPNEIIVDSFAGGGGASQGILWALGRSPDIAINHDKEAIALHAANHPDSLHLSEDVWHVDPVAVCAGRPVGLMWLSPDCKHFSKAKGGKPVSKKIRGLAWVAVRWAKAVRPRVIVLENVEEFQTWGPVDRVTQRPDKERRGLTFRRFCGRLRSLGYQVEHRELRACDYGAPTIRKRLFLIARCDGVAITWPAATHGKNRPHPWRTAAECIQWEIPCPSIFERKKPLAENTQRRISRGLKRFVIDNPRPFIVNMAHGGKLEDMNSPISTIATEKGGCRALVAPTLVQTGYGEREGQKPRSLNIQSPLGTVVAGGQKHALVSAFMSQAFAGNYTGAGAQLTMPLPTITSQDHNHLVAAHLTNFYTSNVNGGESDLRQPLRAITAGGLHVAEVRAFLVQYYSGGSQAGKLDDPMPAVVSKDRIGLVTVEGVDYAIADIGMRMLAPRELYRAQGFPDSYKIDIPFTREELRRIDGQLVGVFVTKPLSKTAQVRMVGNSVAPDVACAIVSANLRSEVLERAA